MAKTATIPREVMSDVDIETAWEDAIRDEPIERPFTEKELADMLEDFDDRR